MYLNVYFIYNYVYEYLYVDKCPTSADSTKVRRRGWITKISIIGSIVLTNLGAKN